MSISPLSSLIYSTAQMSPPSSIQEDLAELAAALQSGDLQSAQQAYSNLRELRASQSSSSSAPIASGASGGTSANPVATDFAALGRALSSGDLDQAQAAFTQLKSAIQAARQPGSGGGATGAQAPRPRRHQAAGAGSFGTVAGPSGGGTSSPSAASSATGRIVNLLG